MPEVNSISKYLEAIQKEIKEAKELKKKKYSDTKDPEGNQYVNLVQEGGTVLGLAHVGYTYILEEAGIRFWRLAGTSAGAINAVLLAAIGQKSEKKSEKMLGIIAQTDFIQFVDGPSWLPGLLKKWVSNSGHIADTVIFYLGIFLLTIVNILFLSFYRTEIYAYYIYFLLGLNAFLILILVGAWRVFSKNNWGLNPGNIFRNWLHEILKSNNAETLKKLKAKSFIKYSQINLYYPNDYGIPFAESDVNFITTDITQKKKVNLPQDARKYGWNEDSEVADFVRCSMSIPFFFSPFIKQYTEEENGEEKDKIVYFVDGGALSNFPISIFHNPKIKYPRLPVFGVLLDSLEVKDETFSLSKFVSQLINTLKSYGDKEFLSKHKFYSEHCVKVVDTSKFNSLNFSMTEEEKVRLFATGAKAAIEFLNKFDWESYKEDRKKLYCKFHKCKDKNSK